MILIYDDTLSYTIVVKYNLTPEPCPDKALNILSPET